MIVLSGADLVLPDRLLGPGSIVIEGERIVDVRPGSIPASAGDIHFDLHAHYIVAGFIDAHVHGVEGHDTLDGARAVGAMASVLPRYGVTAFCPTSVACAPDRLRQFLLAVRQARVSPAPQAARVLPAHLESNFINPEARGAQPVECLRLPPAHPPKTSVPADASRRSAYGGEELLAEIERGQADVGIVTLAPELEGAMDLIAWVRRHGPIVSLGHSLADYEQACDAVAAGASQATHLFNCMPKIDHRSPGLAGAMLEREDVAVELVCDGYHVHPAILRMAIGAKTPARVMAITDGTAGAGLPAGARASLGGQSFTVRDSACFLDDGTLAGSVLTMDRAFRMLIGRIGLTPVDAAVLCSTTPARELRLDGFGVVAPGAMADLAVLDATCQVRQTWIGGQLAYSALPAAS